MSSSDAHHLNSESLKIVQILIDKLNFLNASNHFIDEVDLFTKACNEANIHLDKFFSEDISNICLFSCQIIINHNICLISSSGASKDESFKKSVRKFIEYSFRQNQNNNNQHLLNDAYEYFTVDEAFENYNDINTVGDFVKFCRDYLVRSLSIEDVKVMYNNIKHRLNTNAKSKSLLSESYWFDGLYMRCSIFLHGNLLLQQGLGENEEIALENAIEAMFDVYSMKPGGVYTENSSIDKSRILEQMAVKFEENRSNSSNYWETIHKCAEELQFPLQLQFNDNICTLSIKDVEILKFISKNKYDANIDACKTLMKMFAKASHTRNAVKQNGLVQMNKHKDAYRIINDNIKKVMDNVKTAMFDQPANSDVWKIVNEEFLKENMKLELKYETNNTTQKVSCHFNYQYKKIISGEGISRSTSREDAARKLVNQYL